MTTRTFRAVVVLVTIVTLEVLVLHGYFNGSLIPPWDFLGGYNTDAYIWWTEGNFFAPLNWVPNTWAGYPAALSLQNSAWYLPVGIASLFGPFTLQSAAILAALHTGLGSIGTYLLVRSFKQPFVVALTAAVAGFFAVGYFSNAEHVDFNRGYALLPWLLLILSPAWPWKRWWSIPVASLVLWQVLTGVYPGMLTSMAYAGSAWVIAFQIIARPRLKEYVLPAAVSFVVSLLLSAPRLLPYLLLSGDTASGLPEDSKFSFSMIGTLLYGYSSPALPNDISMRSFFLPATVLAFAFFASWRHRITKLAVAILIPAVALGMPFLPWFGLIQNLPGLNFSRYTMSDFKMFFVLGVLLLACSGFSHLIQLTTLRRSFWWRIGALVAFGAVMGMIGITGPYTKLDWMPGFLLLGASGISILIFAFPRPKAPWITMLSVIVVTLTAVSGLVWAYTTAEPWSKNRVAGELETYGDTVDNLILQRREPRDLAQRPARIPAGADLNGASMSSARWNRVYYLGVDSVGGYVNFKGSETHARLQNTLLNPSLGSGFADFLAAPGAVMTAAEGHQVSAQNFEKCATNQSQCGIAKITPIKYKPGEFRYKVVSPVNVIGYLNESYFKGWSAQLCRSLTNCADISAERSEFGIIKVSLPAGSYTLGLDYNTPGRTTGWILFAVACLIALGSTFLPFVRRSSRKKRVQT